MQSHERPAFKRAHRKWSLMGVHKATGTARVRFHLPAGDEDIDIPLPVVTLPGVSPTAEIYEHLLAPTLEAMATQKAGA